MIFRSTISEFTRGYPIVRMDPSYTRGVCDCGCARYDPDCAGASGNPQAEVGEVGAGSVSRIIRRSLKIAQALMTPFCRCHIDQEHDLGDIEHTNMYVRKGDLHYKLSLSNSLQSAESFER